MKALILAAGRGTRLAPYTDDCPKCMVALAGRTLIDRQLEVLHRHDLHDITFVAGFRAQRLQAQQHAVVVNHDYATTNMVWSMMCARHLFDASDDVLVCYSDIVYEPRVLDAVLSAPGPLVVAADRGWHDLWSIRMQSPLEDVETFRLNDDGSLRELGKKPRRLDEVQGQYMGLVRFDRSMHEALLDVHDALHARHQAQGLDFSKLYMTDFLQALIDAGWRAEIAWTDHGWLEVDTVADLQTYERLASLGSLDPLCRLSVGER